MAYKRHPALDVVKWRSPTEIWIDHAHISNDSLKHFAAVEKITMWNVTYCDELFDCLPQLWWLDIRGGTIKNIHSLPAAVNLRYLQLNQIRGLNDLTEIETLKQLELLSLYGLPKVCELPHLNLLTSLKRVEIGQMKGLRNLNSVWASDQLEEIYLSQNVPIDVADIDSINGMSNLKAFDWNATDIPARRFMPIRTGVTIPQAHALHAEEWFQLQNK